MTQPLHRRDGDKELVKQALKEWVDEKAAQFGWWSMKAIAAVAFSVLIYLYLTSQGWVHK